MNLMKKIFWGRGRYSGVTVSSERNIEREVHHKFEYSESFLNGRDPRLEDANKKLIKFNEKVLNQLDYPNDTQIKTEFRIKYLNLK